jgi:epoxyqueuosine reductase
MPFESDLRNQARSLGFSLVGIARAHDADYFLHFQEWLASGYAGTMSYMERDAEARRSPTSILTEVRSVVMVALAYGESRDEESEARNAKEAIIGKVARYAHGPDYHIVLRAKLKELLAWVQGHRPNCRGRAVVDTAPLLERDFARRAGLGWIGKNTMLINKHRGSYFFLGALLLDFDLTPDDPHTGFHCGTCTACLDACPTDAFPAPGVLDARRCISYLTIEHRGSAPPDLRSGVGDWLFGCDVCQEVCPWNRRDESKPETIDAVEVLTLSEAGFRERFGGSALERTRRRGLVRNAAIVLGNTGDERALPALRRAATDDDEIVRDAAKWAIEQIANRHSPP